MWYAQHGEDQRLAAILGDKATGFYIDVGAWEPVVDSVTKHFYDRGWRGINIEPVPYYHNRLTQERPRDINMQVAVSDDIGIAQFTHIHATGLSTFVPEYRDKFVRGRTSDTFDVQVWTLDYIAARHIPLDQHVDFLKIDVEGWERPVVLGAKRLLHDNPPTVLVIEATVPGTDIPAWETWDQLVRASGYQFVEFDGLNRWYVRSWFHQRYQT